jgi:hypothetical protein
VTSRRGRPRWASISARSAAGTTCSRAILRDGDGATARANATKRSGATLPSASTSASAPRSEAITRPGPLSRASIALVRGAIVVGLRPVVCPREEEPRGDCGRRSDEDRQGDTDVRGRRHAASHNET